MPLVTDQDTCKWIQLREVEHCRQAATDKIIAMHAGLCRGASTLPVANDKSDDDASFLLQSLEVLAHGNPRASQVVSAQPGSHTLQ